jgi:hypothetical protein
MKIKSNRLDKVEITEGALDNMIDYMSDYIYTYLDKEADRATRPLEISFLDYLISLKRHKS